MNYDTKTINLLRRANHNNVDFIEQQLLEIQATTELIIESRTTKKVKKLAYVLLDYSTIRLTVIN